MSCSSGNKKSTGPIDKFDSDCVAQFWHVTVPKNIFDRAVIGEIERQKLKKKCNFSVYFRLRSMTDHAALIFTNGDDKTGFTVELTIRIEANTEEHPRIELFTRKMILKENEGWVKMPVKIESSQKLIYHKAINVMRSFGKYDEKWHNCQDFVLAFCRAIGVPKPFKGSSEKLADAAHIAATPLLAVGGLVAGTALLLLTPSWILSMPREERREYWMWPVAMTMAAFSLPLHPFVSFENKDEEAREEQLQRAKAARDGLKVKDALE